MQPTLSSKPLVVSACVAVVAVALLSPVPRGAAMAQQPTVSDAQPERFAVGRFEADGKRFIGLVVRDAWVIDLAHANKELQRASLLAPEIPMPSDVKELAARYEGDLQRRLYQIVNHVTGSGLLSGGDAPGYVHALDDVDILAPIRPNKILNAAVNYAAHGAEMGGEAHQKGTPYLFLKATSSIIGDGEPIVVPREGYPWVHPDMMDWEVELALVIGRPARYASLENARDHIFGYTVHNDVSNRGGRGDDSPMGSDWLVGKGLDSYGPLGPWIVPKEFIGDADDLDLRLVVDGDVMQESNTSFSINKPDDLIYYASSLLTLESGDVIATGTPEGVGAGRDPQVFLQAGQSVEAWIEEIGSLRNPVVQ